VGVQVSDTQIIRSFNVCVIFVDCIVSFSQRSYNVTEGDTLSISLITSYPSQSSFSVQVLGTMPLPLVITIPAGETSVTIDDDNICEDDKTFTVSIDASSLPGHCVVGDPDNSE